MAEFLDTQGVSYYLKRLINNSAEKLLLISPYLQLNNQLKLAIEDRHQPAIEITIVYGKSAEKISSSDLEWIKAMSGIRLKFLKDVHAKCYLNEKEAIVTSMNLYTFSQQNNLEMGIYASKVNDHDLYCGIVNEADRILRASKLTTPEIEKTRFAINNKTDLVNQPKKANSGYCIRTGVEIAFNIEKPFSPAAFKKWDEHGNWDFSEKYCHFSGEPSYGETSRQNPILWKNYKKAKTIHKF